MEGLSVKSAVINGAAIGAFTGFGISTIVSIYDYFSIFGGPDSLGVILSRAFYVIVITALAGGWAGKKMAVHLIDGGVRNHEKSS